MTCVCLLSQLHLSLSSASVQLDRVDCRWKNQIQAVCRQGTSWWRVLWLTSKIGQLGKQCGFPALRSSVSVCCFLEADHLWIKSYVRTSFEAMGESRRCQLMNSLLPLSKWDRQAPPRSKAGLLTKQPSSRFCKRWSGSCGHQGMGVKRNLLKQADTRNVMVGESQVLRIKNIHCLFCL